MKQLILALSLAVGVSAPTFAATYDLDISGIGHTGNVTLETVPDDLWPDELVTVATGIIDGQTIIGVSDEGIGYRNRIFYGSTPLLGTLGLGILLVSATDLFVLAANLPDTDYIVAHYPDIAHDLDYPETFTADFSLTLMPSAAPEPATWMMMALGFTALGFAAQWRRHSA
jgi:hypothetical protein